MSISMSAHSSDLTNALGLIEALRDPTRTDHQSAMTALETCVGKSNLVSLSSSTEPFVSAMIHIFTAKEIGGLTIDSRQLAGYIIKNYVLTLLPVLSQQLQQHIKLQILSSLSDPLIEIRSTAATIAGRISEAFPFPIWNDMMSLLLQMLDFAGVATIKIDGALLAVRRMCEDSPEKLCMEAGLIEELLPRLIALFSCREEANIRQRALESINCLLFLLYDSDSDSGSGRESILSRFGPSLLSAIGQLAADTSADVRRAVCQVLVSLATYSPELLNLQSSGICQFMVAVVRDSDESVAMEACEFWSILVDEMDLQVAVSPHLPVLIPSLISRMTLGEEQIRQERADEITEATGEKQLHSLKPVHHKTSSAAEEDAEKEALARFTLRKAAARVLDNIASSFPTDNVLPCAMPVIFALLQTTSDEDAKRDHGKEAAWVRESGILALGALSSGCIDSSEMVAQLPQILTFLTQSLSDAVPELCSIAAWALSRYCSWIFFGDHDENLSVTRQTIFKNILQGLLTNLMNPSPRVQVASLSSLSAIFEYAGDELLPYLQQIFNRFQEVSGIFGVKSALVLVDTIAVLAESVGDALADPSYTPLFMPLIMRYFTGLEDPTDFRLFPILECLTSVTSAMKEQSKPYANVIYTRCLSIIDNTLKANLEADRKANSQIVKGAQSSGNTATDVEDDDDDEEDDDLPSKDFAICSLDVLSGLCEGLGADFLVLPESSGTGQILLMHLLTCMSDDLPELRQSAFSLAGEFSRSCVSFILPIAAQFLELALRNLDVDHPMVCNNACWSIGELAMQVGGQSMSPFITQIMHKFIFVLQNTSIPLILRQNVAVAIGRLGVTNPQQIADVLPDFFGEWCASLKFAESCNERENAYSGLVAAIKCNPAILFQFSTLHTDPTTSCSSSSSELFQHQRKHNHSHNAQTVLNAFAFVLSCASWQDPPSDALLADISQILAAIKNQPSGSKLMSWDQMMLGMDSSLAANVRDLFKLS